VIDLKMNGENMKLNTIFIVISIASIYALIFSNLQLLVKP